MEELWELVVTFTVCNIHFKLKYFPNKIADGGVAMHMFINDKYTCSSSAVYGTRNEGDSMGGMSHGHGGSKGMVKRYPQGSGKELLTVASMSDCEGPFKVKKGDYVVLKAEYDLKKHPL